MYRVRFHGRGGQGMKTASRLLGTALFLSGYEVQDAPRYGAERRGAPIFAYVRAGREKINERGTVAAPDLLIVADDTLTGVAAAGVLTGLTAETVIAIASRHTAINWQQRLAIDNRIIVLPESEARDADDIPDISGFCAGAAARLLGVISKENLLAAVEQEMSPLGIDAVAVNKANILAGYQAMAADEGCVDEGGEQAAEDYRPPNWIDLQLETGDRAAPNIYASATSVEVRTGLWRTMRPIIDYDACGKCTWICGSYCPDSVIALTDADYPVIDYDHCKGCMICVVQCPRHAIAAVPEAIAAAEEGREA
jgi:pyruvate ferredoxin oxidoreductase gamma subunit